MLVSPAEIAQQLGFKPDRLPAYAAAKPAKEGEESPESDLIPITLWQPIEGSENTLPKTLSMHEAFAVYIKAALLVGLVLSSPWVFYQIWAFVAAGLYPHEKKYIHIFLPISLGLFIAGVATVFLVCFSARARLPVHVQLDAENRSGPTDRILVELRADFFRLASVSASSFPWSCCSWSGSASSQSNLTYPAGEWLCW